ncbi:hypothetical protein BASA84_000731 [Batrachochytrium salamandrivorans]|nr:hypothetical protein BASA84_000731 [Batrachochytrium salamandrivorans]
MEHVSKIDRRTNTNNGARFRITVPRTTTTQYHPAPRAPKQANSLGIRQNYRHRRPDQLDQQPHLHHYHGRSSQQCCQHQATTSCYPPHCQKHQLWATQKTCITSSKFRLTVPGFDVIPHPALDLDAEELP